jgi:hypothetical protein
MVQPFFPHSNISNTALSASVSPHEACSILLPHSDLSNSNTLLCRCQLMPGTGDCRGAEALFFYDSGSRTCAILSWNRCII